VVVAKVEIKVAKNIFSWYKMEASEGLAEECYLGV
jgi:hypothetical protein